MFARMLSAFTKRRPAEPARSEPDPAAEALAFFSRQVGAMPAVEPPAIVANDPLAALCEPVERELRRAGHLR